VGADGWQWRDADPGSEPGSDPFCEAEGL